MSRKDYVALAASLAQVRPDGEQEFNGWSDAVRAVADVLESDNERFDRQRFLFAAMAEHKESK